MLATEKTRHGLRWLVAAGLIPILLCLMFTLLEAGQMVKRQLAVTSSMLMSQAENISDRARVMTASLQEYKNHRCADIKDELQEYGSMHPYFRSVGLVQDGNVVCSSTFGERQDSIEDIIRRPLPPEHKDLWSLSVAGTSGVRNRPAVLFMHEDRDGFASYALVDGQYFIDFIWAAGMRHDYDISMKFGDGFAMFSGVPATRQSDKKWGNYTLNTHSERYAITLSVTSSRSELLYNWQQVLFSLMPMALILSLLFVALTSNWLKRKSSFRDEIRRGIERNEFSVHYQPVFNLQTQKFSGAEALMRWQRPDGHWVRPDVFISAAESEGMIVPLTRYLLQRVIQDSAQWQLEPGFHLSVNLAAEHLQHDEFMSDIRAFAAGMDHLKPTITLELTERSLIGEDRMVSQRLAELRREGIIIAIDDFGTGHCALSYLQTFPLDYLKIDRGFVNTIESVDGETPVLDAIISLADKLALKVVAEGVENEMQLCYLQNHGVSLIQGYYFARPMESAALSEWLQEHNGSGPQEPTTR
ncbi:EAL domain-containing protein [Erwinia sp. S43]|uniref:EAL domain-containing protein n=1 Tax=unclassified Erwinia TaxID=2622719 RepID=UPI00190CDB82|nr:MULTISPECIES: EAL domain-containing protein [unclassified Erwinia]MBK0033486.1 EAL domain-containing protein [Erwinia sp. S43]MCW1874284.1 EAL domain-containing protein [Erwinia sp. INIA01]